jgi:hypothetical protein
MIVIDHQGATEVVINSKGVAEITDLVQKDEISLTK